MKRAGTAVGIAQGVVVVRMPNGDELTLGTELVDDSLDTVGHVVDLFGPVDRPYLAVSPTVENPALLVGNPLYTQT
ncbi:H/ACA ribonucleoprotein complex subunit GAR1 [Halovenus rubra]|uniref:H/ACA ribonucleoprotein complex subunit GAR1 n=2 Tax=Halovenus rubra TaxID=869890 RepID=A0ABD5XAZ8_9EURY|nr:Gar1/Naf1 family protein [Halovenus rubra]